MISVLGFVSGKLIAQQQGVSDQDSTQLGILGAIMGFTPISVAATMLIAQQEVPPPPPPPSISGLPVLGGGAASNGQNPPAGGAVQAFTMPNLVGTSAREAKQQIASLFPKEPEIVESHVSNNATRGTIVNTFPAANASFDPATTTISLLVSAGPTATAIKADVEKGEKLSTRA